MYSQCPDCQTRFRVTAEMLLGIALYVLLVPGRSPDAALAEDILAFARRRLAPYKRVRRIEFVSELPKTISGKIRRVALRAQEASRHAAGQRAPLEFREEDFPRLRQDP